MAITWRGHRIWTHSRDRRAEFPDQGFAAVKWWGECSCGWKSTACATEDGATGAALNHAWRVTVAPEYPVKGRMEKRRGETMSKRQFMDAVRQTRASA